MWLSKRQFKCIFKPLVKEWFNNFHCYQDLIKLKNSSEIGPYSDNDELDKYIDFYKKECEYYRHLIEKIRSIVFDDKQVLQYSELERNIKELC